MLKRHLAPYHLFSLFDKTPLEEDEVIHLRDELPGTKVIAVGRTHFISLPLTSSEPQILDIDHCVYLIGIDRHFGEFHLLDASQRVIATSNHGRLSLLKKDIKTEVGHVWYDATSRTSKNYKFLHEEHKIKDPGLDLGSLQPLSIQFLGPPKVQTRIEHISVYFKGCAIWDTERFQYL